MREFYDREIRSAVVDFRRLQVREIRRPRMLLGAPAHDFARTASLRPERPLNATPSRIFDMPLVAVRNEA